MFETVGRGNIRQRRRQAGALFLSLLLNGGALAGLVLAGSRVAIEVAEVEEPMEIPVELASPAPLAASLPRSAAPARHSRRAPAATPAVAPEVALPDVAVLTPDAAPEAPTGGGGGGGIGDSDASGGGDGELGGGGPGGGGGIKSVHWSEVQFKVRPSPRAADYPAAAAALGLPATRCVVRVSIDEKGVPIDVSAKACPAVFVGAATDLAMRYRCYPLLEDGHPVRAAFDLALTFAPSE